MIPCNHFKNIIDLRTESIQKAENKYKQVSNGSKNNENCIKRTLNQTSLFNVEESLTKGIDKFSSDKIKKYNKKKYSNIQYSLCNESTGKIRTRLNSRFGI